MENNNTEYESKQMINAVFPLLVHKNFDLEQRKMQNTPHASVICFTIFSPYFPAAYFLKVFFLYMYHRAAHVQDLQQRT